MPDWSDKRGNWPGGVIQRDLPIFSGHVKLGQVLSFPNTVNEVFNTWQWKVVWHRTVVYFTEVCAQTQGPICLRNHDNGRGPRTGTLLYDALVEKIIKLVLEDLRLLLIQTIRGTTDGLSVWL